MTYRKWLIGRIARAKRELKAVRQAQRREELQSLNAGSGQYATDETIYLGYELQAVIHALEVALEMHRELEPRKR